ncbi:MAG: DUF58 domain-containing protein [Candidatus Omnitrophica bacterium]|nr:DUF58 domain-containing protein [Candidatus Omnitrophota bacterium]
MIPKEIIKSVRRIQISTNRLVSDVFSGQYKSVFKGQGIEFDEVREYMPGDEIRSIDWNVTARMNTPYVKQFVEERELTVMLLLDMSQSSMFGTSNRLKQQVAAELCSLLAFSAIKNNDKVGFISFTDKIEKFLPPRKGVGHVLRVIRDALYFKPTSKGTNIQNAIDFLNKVCNRRVVCFVISDFYDKNFKRSMSIANKRHDIVAVTITDPCELELPKLGILNLWDAESGKEYIIDTSPEKVRREYKIRALKKFRQREKIFTSINVDNIDIRTNIPYINSLVKFFDIRERRKR